MRISDWSSDVCSSDLIGIEDRRLLKQIGGVVRKEESLDLHTQRRGNNQLICFYQSDPGDEKNFVTGKIQKLVEGEILSDKITKAHTIARQARKPPSTHRRPAMTPPTQRIMRSNLQVNRTSAV